MVLTIEASSELSMPSMISTPADTEVSWVEVETIPPIEEEPEDQDSPPDLLTVEPIMLSLPLGTILFVAYLLIISNVAGDV
jgi:hypothetical protein